jgi:hypothetical protein
LFGARLLLETCCMEVGIAVRTLSLLIAMGAIASCADSAPALTIIEPGGCFTGFVATSIDASQCITDRPIDAACAVRWSLDLGAHPGSSATIQDDALVLLTTNTIETAAVTVVSTAQLQGDFDVGVQFSGLNTMENAYVSLNIALVDSDDKSQLWIARVAIGSTPVPAKNGVFLSSDIGRVDPVFREGLSSAGWLRYSRRGQRLTTTATLDGLPALQNEIAVTTAPLGLSVGLFGIPSSVRIERIESGTAELNDEFRCHSLARLENSP